MMKFFFSVIFLSFSVVLFSCNSSDRQYDDNEPVTLEWNSDGKEEYPWEIWSKTVNWSEKPSEKEVIYGYYNKKCRETECESPVEITDYERIKTDPASLGAPTFETEEERLEFAKNYRYGRGLIIHIEVKGKYLKLFIADGWEVVS